MGLMVTGAAILLIGLLVGFMLALATERSRGKTTNIEHRMPKTPWHDA